MEHDRFQYEALKWLYELNVLNNPQLINNLKLNVLMVSKSIREVELLVHIERKQMLVYLDLSWFGRRFKKTSIFAETEHVLIQLLPSFRFRVTDDPEIMNLAVRKVRKNLRGGTYAKPGDNNGDASRIIPEPYKDEGSITNLSPGPKSAEASTKE